MVSKKEEIIKAAAELFSQKGYHLSISDIAKKVNIKPPSIYSHFQSKDEIIEQVVMAEIEQFYGVILNHYLESSKSLTFKEQLEHIFWQVLQYFDQIERFRFWRNIISIENDLLRQKCKNTVRTCEVRFHQNFENLFQKGVDQHEIKETVNEGDKLLFLAMLKGILSRLYIYQTLINENECAAKTLAAYWDSIK